MSTPLTCHQLAAMVAIGVGAAGAARAVARGVVGVTGWQEPVGTTAPEGPKVRTQGTTAAVDVERAGAGAVDVVVGEGAGGSEVVGGDELGLLGEFLA